MTNEACIGYMILAAKMYGLSETEIKILEEHMPIVMDEYTEEQAKEAYRTF